MPLSAARWAEVDAWGKAMVAQRPPVVVSCVSADPVRLTTDGLLPLDWVAEIASMSNAQKSSLRSTLQPINTIPWARALRELLR